MSRGCTRRIEVEATSSALTRVYAAWVLQDVPSAANFHLVSRRTVLMSGPLAIGGSGSPVGSQKEVPAHEGQDAVLCSAASGRTRVADVPH
jgi:hypothetical protein